MRAEPAQRRRAWLGDGQRAGTATHTTLASGSASSMAAAQAGYGGDAPVASTAVELTPADAEEEEENPDEVFDEHATDSEMRRKARDLLEVVPVQIFMLVCTVVALFSEDTRVLLGKGADPLFHALTMFVFVAFVAELALTIYVNQKENWFYTFLDFVATFSLILDMWFVQAAMASDIDPLAPTTFQNITSGADDSALADSLVLTRASRAARAGTKMGRLFKLTRLMRVGKMFKICAKMSNNKEKDDSAEASDMSRRMAEIITGKVIIIVLVMLFAMPFLEVEVVDDFPAYGLDVIEMAQDGVCGQGTSLVSDDCVALCAAQTDGCTRAGCRTDLNCVYEPTVTFLVDEYVANADAESMANAGVGRILRVTVGTHVAYKRSDFDATTADVRTEFLSGYASKTGGVGAVWEDTTVIHDDATFSIWRTVFVILLLGFGSVLFGKDAARLSARITKPLGVLAADMAKVSELELEHVEAAPSPIFEVNVMLDSFDKMKTGLVSFVKFVPRMVVKNLLRAGKTGVTGVEGVERKQLTIFFSNIANFEEVSEKLETLEMMEMLSDYFSEMSTIFEATDGTLIEFVGDEILALWNAPQDVGDHQATCCDAALKMQARVKECFDTRWQDKGWPWIDVKIGVNTASVFVGNLGAPDRMKYGVLGDGVNMAARLQMLNRRYKTKILGTQTIVDDVKVQETFRTRCVDVVAVKVSHIQHTSGRCLLVMPAWTFSDRLLALTRLLRSIQGKTIGVSVYEIMSRKDDESDAEVHDKIVNT